MNADGFHSSLIEDRVRLLNSMETAQQQVHQYFDQLGSVLQQRILQSGQIEAQNLARQFQALDSLAGQGQRAIASTYTQIRKVSDQLITGVERAQRVGVSNLSPLVNPLSKTNLNNLLVQQKPVNSWWEGQKRSLVGRFSMEVRSALGKGLTKQQVVDQIVGKRLAKGWGGILPYAENQARALVKTTLQAVSNEVLYQTYLANDDLFYGIQWSAVLDGKTTPLCRGRDGMAWDLKSNLPLGTAPTKTLINFPGIPPAHFCCRSLIVPLTRSKDDLQSHPRLGPLLAKLPAKVRNKMTGTPASRLTYADWLRSQPVDKQKALLGESKYKLWKARGKLDLAGL